MAITLITGPANAGKARAVLDAVCADAVREREPLLVVPTHADVEHYRRELATKGVVWGVRVERFRGLLDEVVRRAGTGGRALSPLLRERALRVVATRVCADAQLAKRSGYVRVLTALIGELEVQRVTSGRLQRALTAWVAAAEAHGDERDEEPQRRGRARRASELEALFGGYHELLEQIGAVDPDARAARALDALRRAPVRWGGTPVHLYGFDDLTPLQLDAIETLGRVVDVPLTVSLPYEAGREAFAGRAGALQTMLPWAGAHRELPAREDYYAPHARSVLHRLERGLFESQSEREPQPELVSRPNGEPPLEPEPALRLLEGGSPRAELELVAGEIRALLDVGMSAQEIAVVHRSPRAIADLLGEVLEEHGVPFAPARRTAFGDTSLGRALCGLLAAALSGKSDVAGKPDVAEEPNVTGEPGGAGEDNLQDLLAWLRAPGVLERPALADAFEADARRRGITGIAEARALWEATRWPLDTLERVREAARRGPAALIERMQGELRRLFAAPRRGLAQVPAGVDQEDARALAAGNAMLAELAEATAATPLLAPDAGELLALLRDMQLPLAPDEGLETVTLTDPLALRARRVRALFLCGLQANVFPAATQAPPWLSEQERRSLAEVSGLRLAPAPAGLAAERYLFYAAVSRPEELLVLSWHGADEDGASVLPSLFVEDVCDLFGGDLRGDDLHGRDSRGRRRWRAAGEAGWPGPGAPPAAWAERELALAAPPCEPSALAPLRDATLLAELRRGRLWSASSLRSWSDCPARWFVESVLVAGDLDPSAEPLARGGLAHAALKDTLEGLRRETGSARLMPASLRRARELLHEALARHAVDFPLSVHAERVPGMRRRLQADLDRYLECAAQAQSPLEPTHLELSFGFERDEDDASVTQAVLPALDIGEGVRVRGRIDRIDVGPAGEAVVYDYKSGSASPPDRWLPERQLQAAIYMRAARDLLGADVRGGFYQPLAGRDLRARGVLAAADDDGDGNGAVELECVRGDTREAAAIEDLIDEILALARRAAHEADAGLLDGRPGTCAFGDGRCSYPSICRCER